MRTIMLARTSRGLAVAAIAAAAVGGLAACGTSSDKTASQSPKDAITTAYTKLLDHDSLTATVKIDESANDLVALSTTNGSTDDPDNTPLTQQQANAIAGGSIQLAEKVSSGTLGKPVAGAASSSAITVNAGDDPKLVEFRVVDKKAYARVDVPQFEKYGAIKQSDLAELTGPSAPPQAAFLKDVVAGKWIQLPLQDALDAEGGAAGAKPSVSPTQTLGALQNIFTKDVSSTKVGKDSTLGDQYNLVASSRVVATDLVATVKSELGSIPGADKELANLDPATVPDKNVTVQAFVKNDTLNAVRLDVAQFLTGADLASLKGKPFYIEADFSNTADVSAPASSTNVTFGSLVALFEGLSGGSGTTSGGATASGTATPAT
jgi:hypothetical protein